MAGAAELPLHSGKVPPWMMEKMKRLGAAIAKALVEERGPSALLRGLSDPLWFQAFSNAVGMDWDSSGSTAVVIAVLKEAARRDSGLGLVVLGGKGKSALAVPEEAKEAEKKLGVPSELLTRASKLAARADSAFLQDGYELYVHAVFADAEGSVVVVQQGMNLERKLARRYHVARQAIEEPHSGVAGVPGAALNATARESREARKAYLDVVREGPRRFERMLAEASRILRGDARITDFLEGAGGGFARCGARELLLVYKPVRPSRRLVEAVERLAEMPIESDEELALAPGVGPALVRALALVAHVIYGVPTSFRDPVTHILDPFAYSFAIGGKDGVPYPFSAKLALKVAETLEEAVERAKLGDREKLEAVMRLRRLVDKLGAR